MRQNQRVSAVELFAEVIDHEFNINVEKAKELLHLIPVNIFEGDCAYIYHELEREIAAGGTKMNGYRSADLLRAADRPEQGLLLEDATVFLCDWKRERIEDAYNRAAKSLTRTAHDFGRSYEGVDESIQLFNDHVNYINEVTRNVTITS
jgi:hypothetical protein